MANIHYFQTKTNFYNKKANQISIFKKIEAV